jgi:antirestriction protein ArdC
MASALCADLGITPEVREDASYIAEWLTVLKDDKRAVFTAASQAQPVRLIIVFKIIKTTRTS